MSFPAFLVIFTALISAGAIAIIERMPFPPLLIWAAKMIVVLVASVTIYAGLRVR